jgi:hypothetical protein
MKAQSESQSFATDARSGGKRTELSVEGLWTAEFGSTTGISGGGVVVMQGGRLLGGDGGYYYHGDYAVKEASITASLSATPFNLGMESVFATLAKELKIELKGVIISKDQILAQGKVADLPGLLMGVKLTKRC